MKNTIFKSLLAATTIIASAGYASAQDCDATFTVTDLDAYTISCEPLSTADDIVVYEWTFGDETLPSLVMVPTHTYGASGTYTVCLTVTTEATSCMECTSIIMGGATSAGNIALKDSDTRIFPNPGADYWNLEINLKSAQNLDIQVADVAGKIVYKNTLKGKTGKNVTTITNKNIAAGVYFITISDGSTVITKKAVKL